MTARLEEVRTRATPSTSRSRLSPSVREAVWGYMLISPWLIGLMVFTAIPIVASLLLSFTDYDILNPDKTHWVGLANYAWAAADPGTLDAAFTTLKFAAVTVPLTLGVALGIAILVNHRLLVGKRVFRTLFFLPVQIPVTASVFIWLGFIVTGRGIPMTWLHDAVWRVAETLSGLPVFSTLAAVYPTGWFTDPGWRLPWLILLNVWGIGNMTLIFLAGLQAVPTSLYDAAKADGAGPWRTLRHVTLPMISPMIFYNLILSIISVAGYFSQAYLLGFDLWNVNLYQVGWHENHMGRACALAWILFIVAIAISALLFWGARRWVYYAGGDATSSKTLPTDPESVPAATPVAPPVRLGRSDPVEAAAATAPTATARRGTTRPRSKLNRFARRATARTAFTLATAALCVAFLLPMLFALSFVFHGPNSGAPGAPLYPAVERTYSCTDPQLCTYQPVLRNLVTGELMPWGAPVSAASYGNGVLPVYDVPGHGALALLDDRWSQSAPSLFVDPATHKQVAVAVNPSELTPVWDFSMSLENFSVALDWAAMINPLGGMAGWLLNTGVIALFSVLGAVLSSVVVGYGFARFRFPGRGLLFLVLIGSVLIPYQVTLIPQFILYQWLGLTGGLLPLIIPSFFGNALYIFLLRQFFLAMPRDLDEAAMVDGAGPLRILRSVLAPQAIPAIATVALFQFFFSWNDLLGPLIYLSGRPAQYTASLGVSYFVFALPGGNTSGPAPLVAGSFLIMVVPVVIFFAAQRFFFRGIVISGVEK